VYQGDTMRKMMNFTNKHKEYIEKEAKEKEITFTEMLRRILDKYIEIEQKEKRIR
jgi:hypothetical protein